MSVALSAGVTGLQAHQKMLDVAGNNLANVNTTAYKTTNINFSELLSQTITNASAPTSTVGGTNPQQMGSGVGVSSITRDTTQGNIVKTGNPLDVAIEGEGYFVANDGEKSVYTRAGTFAVDEDGTMVDVATGYRIQRTGKVGESDDFQTAGDSNIYIPSDKPMEPSATTEITLAGNLSSNMNLATTQAQTLTSSGTYTTGSVQASGSTDLDALDSDFYTAGTFSSATITVSGFDHDGTALTDATPLDVDADTDLDDVVAHVQSVLGSSNATVSLSNGRIKIVDKTSGYSRLDAKLTFANSGTAEVNMPPYFEMTALGGEEVKDISITTYDSVGESHILSGALTRTGTANQWDFVVTSVTGAVNELTIANRRIDGLSFDADTGAYAGFASSSTESEVIIDFGTSASSALTVDLDFGVIGKFGGLTQVGGPSTAVATEQDGYAKGDLSSLSINSAGTVVGSFSNGVKKNIAMLQMALFRNAIGLESIGKGYYTPTVNSGTAVPTTAQNAGAGAIHGGSLEKSNADVATEFVSLIQAQNGFQANARTIRVANEILRELTQLIR
jgi:flagellar hook protein FlgE